MIGCHVISCPSHLHFFLRTLQLLSYSVVVSDQLLVFNSDSISLCLERLYLYVGHRERKEGLGGEKRECERRGKKRQNGREERRGEGKGEEREEERKR